MRFLVFNVILFVLSVYLILGSFIQYKLFLTLPLPLEIVIGLGLITPAANLYDTIKNFIIMSQYPSINLDEDSND